MKTTRFPAFTLLEILLAVSVFAVVSLLATVSIATTLRIQIASRQNQAISLQSERVLQAIQADVSNSSAPVQIVHSTTSVASNYPFEGMLVVTTPQKEKHIYCMERVTVGTIILKRVVRFTVGDGVTISGNDVCTTGGIHRLSGNTVSPDPEYLTDGVYNGLNMRFWPLFSDVPGVVDAPAVRIELTALYDPRVGDTSIVDRVGSASNKGTQVVVRGVAQRKEFN